MGAVPGLGQNDHDDALVTAGAGGDNVVRDWILQQVADQNKTPGLSQEARAVVLSMFSRNNNVSDHRVPDAINVAYHGTRVQFGGPTTEPTSTSQESTELPPWAAADATDWEQLDTSRFPPGHFWTRVADVHSDALAIRACHIPPGIAERILHRKSLNVVELGEACNMVAEKTNVTIFSFTYRHVIIFPGSDGAWRSDPYTGTELEAGAADIIRCIAGRTPVTAAALACAGVRAIFQRDSSEPRIFYVARDSWVRDWQTGGVFRPAGGGQGSGEQARSRKIVKNWETDDRYARDGSEQTFDQKRFLVAGDVIFGSRVPAAPKIATFF